MLQHTQSAINDQASCIHDQALIRDHENSRFGNL
jgi:hypothetical protein